VAVMCVVFPKRLERACEESLRNELQTTPKNQNWHCIRRNRVLGCYTKPIGVQKQTDAYDIRAKLFPFVFAQHTLRSGSSNAT